MRRGNHLGIAFGLAAATFAVVIAAKAAEKKSPAGETVEFFAAIKAGDIEARFIPRDDRQGRLIITSHVKRPLSLQFPPAIIAAPVLAQVRPPGGQAAQNNQAPQTIGAFPGANTGMPGGGPGAGPGGNPFGNFGGPGGNNFRPGGGNGVFNIPPEKVVTFKLDSVCLEHGKKNPRPNVPYEIRSLETYSDRPAVVEMFKANAESRADRRVLQAAAWRLASDKSWNDLTAMRLEHLNGPSEPYFTKKELDAAKKLASAAEERANKANVEAPASVAAAEASPSR